MRKIKHLSYAVAIASVVTLGACSSSKDDDKKQTEASSSQEVTLEKPSTAIVADYQQDRHYAQISGKILAPDIDTGKALVSEFFWYGCGHCQKLAPNYAVWIKQKQDVQSQYLPIIWNASTEMHARIFLLIQDRHDFDLLHSEMYKLVDSFSRTDTLDDQKPLFKERLKTLGVSEESVDAAINSDQFDAAIATLKQKAAEFGVTSVPTVIVNQEYKVLNKELKSVNDILNIADYLLEKKP